MLKRFLKVISGGLTDSEYEFLDTAKRGTLTIQLIDQYLAQNIDINSCYLTETGQVGNTVLTEYVSSKNIDNLVVQHLLNCGAKAATKYGDKPLSSLSFGHVKKARNRLS